MSNEPNLKIVGGGEFPGAGVKSASGNRIGGGGGDGLEERLAKLEVGMENVVQRLGSIEGHLNSADGRLRSVETDMATLKERISHLPSKGFIVTTTVGSLTVFSALVLFAEKLRTWIGLG